MNNKTTAYSFFGQDILSHINFNEKIIAPLVLRPTVNDSLGFAFDCIFAHGPASIKSECENQLQGSSLKHQCGPQRFILEHTKESTDDFNGSEIKPVQSDFIENSQLYLLFRDDFAQILEYCLYPNQGSMAEYKHKISSHSFALIEMIKKYRVNKLKTEQKVKKIINHAYDMMKRNYLNTQYKNLGHISDCHKKEVFIYYFNKLNENPDEFIQKVKTEPIWRSADKFNLAYNKRFFNYVRECFVFIKDLMVVVDHLEKMTMDTIKNDLRLFIKDVVRFAYQKSIRPINSYLPDESLIRQFFEPDIQRQLNKKGIKFPWTEDQYKKSLEILRNYITTKDYTPNCDDL